MALEDIGCADDFTLLSSVMNIFDFRYVYSVVFTSFYVISIYDTLILRDGFLWIEEVKNIRRWEQVWNKYSLYYMAPNVV